MRLVLIITILILSACATQTVDKRQNNQAAIKFVHGKDGSSGKCVLSGSTDQNIFSFMQRHNFQFKEFDIPEAISHFMQRFDLVISAFQWSS